MQFETVGRISMGHLAFKVRGKIDDIDGRERALLHADTASYTQALRDEGDLRLWRDLDAEFPSAHDRA